MSCMKNDVLKEALVHLVDPYSTISSSDVVKVCVRTRMAEWREGEREGWREGGRQAGRHASRD